MYVVLSGEKLYSFILFFLDEMEGRERRERKRRVCLVEALYSRASKALPAMGWRGRGIVGAVRGEGRRKGRRDTKTAGEGRAVMRRGVGQHRDAVVPSPPR